MNKIIFIFVSFFILLPFVYSSDLLDSSPSQLNQRQNASKRKASGALESNHKRAKVQKTEKHFEIIAQSVVLNDNEEGSEESCERGVNLLVLPKQSFINNEVETKFITTFFKLTGFRIKPYQNADHAEAVMKLPQFCDGGTPMPVMEHGYLRQGLAYVSDGEMNEIQHGFVIGNDDNEVLGAILFTYLLDQNETKIEALGVSKQWAGRGLGSSLTELAIYVGSLYGSKAIVLESTQEAVAVYAKHGFWFYRWQEGENDEYADWKNHGKLSAQQLDALANDFDYDMKLDFSNSLHLEVLDQYRAKHAVTTSLLSTALKANIKILSGYQKQVDNFVTKLDQASSDDRVKRFKRLSTNFEFSEEALSALSLNDKS